MAIRRVVPTFETGIYFPKNAKTSKILFYKVVQKKYKYSNNRVIFFSIAFTEFVNVGAAHTSNHPLSTGRRVEKYIFRRSLMDVSRYLEDVLRKTIPLANPPPEEWQGGDKRKRERGGGEEANSYPSPTIEGGVGWLGEERNGGGFQEGGRRQKINIHFVQEDRQSGSEKKVIGKRVVFEYRVLFSQLTATADFPPPPTLPILPRGNMRFPTAMSPGNVGLSGRSDSFHVQKCKQYTARLDECLAGCRLFWQQIP